MRSSFRTESAKNRWAKVQLRPVFALIVCIAGGGVVLLLTSHHVIGLGADLSSVIPALVLYMAAAGVTVSGLLLYYPHNQLGLCNVVTLARMVIVAVLVVAIFESRVPDVGLLGLAILSLCLDGIDGWLARRQGLVSAFGARFDVEVDAGFALTLAIYAAVTGVAGPYVILLGLPYYVFSLARRIWPWLAAPLPDSFARKAVCVAQIAVLIAMLVPWIPHALLSVAALTVICALVWSFGRDIRFLMKGRLA